MKSMLHCRMKDEEEEEEEEEEVVEPDTNSITANIGSTTTSTSSVLQIGSPVG